VTINETSPALAPSMNIEAPMSTTFPPGGAAGIAARAKAILLSPDTEWPIIAAEPATTGGLYTGYIMILAAIGPIANFLHGVLFGYGAFGFSYHPSFFGALTSAIVSYALTLGGTFLLAVIVAALAPTFQGQNSQIQALKLVAYSGTAGWLASAFNLIPGLGLLSIVGLYGVYLFFRGLPVLMQSPPAKSLPYTIVIFISVLIIGLVVGRLTWSLGYGGGALGGYSDATNPYLPPSHRTAFGGGGTLTTPSGGSVQLDKLAALGAAFSNPGKPTADGSPAGTTPVAALKSMLPTALPGGLARTESSAGGGQFAGIGGSTATATYGTGNHEITLTVVDLGTMGALAGAAGAFGISGEKETPTSYSHITQKDGRTIAEEYDSQARHGTYTVIVGSRFMVAAEGSQLTMDDLHNAVATIDLDHLEAMAH
jgi:hypothetical protein